MTSTSLELEIVATSRPKLVQSLRELWAYRGTILAFAERDIRVKYKQAVLGVAWALIQPLAFLAIFAVFFGRVAKIGAVAGLGPLSYPHKENRGRDLGCGPPSARGRPRGSEGWSDDGRRVVGFDAPVIRYDERSSELIRGIFAAAVYGDTSAVLS